MTDWRAPAFAVYVNGHELNEDVTSSIRAVEYEHTLDMAAVVRIEVDNSNNRFTDSPVFAPGNEIEVHLGYGPEVGFVGRAEIIRHLPSFPQDEAPALQIQGYDRSWRMMRQELDIDGGAGQRPKKSKGESGEVFDTTLRSVVDALLRKHGIEPDVDDELADKPVKFTRKKGTTDYQVIKALANLNGADFWVEFDPTSTLRGTSGAVVRYEDPRAPVQGRGKWFGRFLKPGAVPQTTRYTFRYSTGEDSTLLSCDLEFALPEAPTEIQCWVYDRGKKDWVLIKVEETTEGKAQKFSPGTFARGGAMGPATVEDGAAPIDSMTQMRLAVGGHSIEVITRKFRDPAEAQAFAEQWFKKHKDSFVVATGVLPGVDTLRAGQTHGLEGLGVRYSGDYYLSSVRHKWDGNGYVTEFSARKVLS